MGHNEQADGRSLTTKKKDEYTQNIRRNATRNAHNRRQNTYDESDTESTNSTNYTTDDSPDTEDDINICQM